VAESNRPLFQAFCTCQAFGGNQIQELIVEYEAAVRLPLTMVENFIEGNLATPSQKAGPRCKFISLRPEDETAFLKDLVRICPMGH
jgi:hypothetical protein